MSDDRCSAGTLLGAFLLGGLVGAAVALLTAPKSGKETREEISRWAQDTTEKTKERLEVLSREATEKVKKVAGEAQEKVRGVADRVTEKVREGTGAIRQKIGRREAEGEGDA